ncbi:MAG: N-formylglutamate amidohydrolase [Bacteroidetes bacterium]|nr:N-formylglutamate amidohydrolase [Bacteroidota bacterium]MDA1122224.1 N-formylglutamate amidohydrolase [Bacteroidota bacterium]
MPGRSLVITCEHAGNKIHKDFKYLFKGQKKVLISHRGWDPGALELAKFLSKKSDSVLFQTSISRLLVEANRSDFHPQLFSEYSNPLDPKVKNTS